MPGSEDAGRRDKLLLPLLPLREVLFPHSRRPLTLDAQRHAWLLLHCVGRSQPLAVSCLRQAGDPPGVERVGVLATLAPLAEPGSPRVLCVTGGRLRIRSQVRSGPEGSWLCEARALPEGDAELPAGELLPSVRALAQTIATLRARGRLSFGEPFHLDDAGWVANRWCELLPVPTAAKQKLLELDTPQQRLRIVDSYLREKQIIR